MVNPNNDYYFMQRNTSPLESITIEYGFLDSNKDDVSQLKNNWQKYTDAAVEGILNYIQNTDEDNNVYIVKAGDSLYSIAKKYNTTVLELKNINNLVSDNLKIGQKIILPITTNNSNNYYIVKGGDTLYSIARKYNMSVQELMSINNLTTDNLYVGQKLYLVSDNNKEENIYIVKLGDTLYSIAKRYNVSVNDIMNTNNLTSSLLTIGQELIIP